MIHLDKAEIGNFYFPESEIELHEGFTQYRLRRFNEALRIAVKTIYSQNFPFESKNLPGWFDHSVIQKHFLI